MQANIFSTSDYNCFLLSFQREIVLSFDWPPMDTNELCKMIAGQEARDQNDEGFFVSVGNGLVEISIQPVCEGLEPTKITLSQAICKPAFEQLLPIYLKNDAEIDGDKRMDEKENGSLQLSCPRSRIVRIKERSSSSQNQNRRVQTKTGKLVANEPNKSRS
uniref:Uncharacterized protein n=1 Tax=viral metagenome TaxID=1070528 RepID=A0A6C0CHQ1_9ZZZZ